jgi:hypothetical protein
MDFDELDRLTQQQMFNGLAELALRDMRQAGSSFDEVFPLHLWDTAEKLKFREKIEKALLINTLPISSRGTYATAP